MVTVTPSLESFCSPLPEQSEQVQCSKSSEKPHMHYP
jgi:hypothetical protein